MKKSLNFVFRNRAGFDIHNDLPTIDTSYRTWDVAYYKLVPFDIRNQQILFILSDIITSDLSYAICQQWICFV